ncbi:MAG: hypothetical protein ACREFX_15100 [Opitutaceae bacterium]
MRRIPWHSLGASVRIGLAAFLSAAALAQAAPPRLDAAKLVARFRAWDAARNHGLGASGSADSGVLGWREAGILRGYADLWEATRDPYWLGKIDDQFGRIITRAAPDGWGFLQWTTADFGVGLFCAEPLHNMGSATISPEQHREFSAHRIRLITGASYIVEFTGPEAYRVEDLTRHEWLATGQVYLPGGRIASIPGCTVAISGQAHAGDEFLVRTTAPKQEPFVVHEGMLGYPVAVFIAAVKADPALQPRFGADADRFLAFINRNFVEKWEPYWIDLGRGAGAYRFPPIITDRYPNRVLPHNQYLAMARVYVVLEHVPGADPLMAVRARGMALNFRRNLHRSGTGWRWNYWDWIEGGRRDVGDTARGDFSQAHREDSGHGTIDVGFALEAWRHGVVFTRADIRRFAATYLDAMWNGSNENPRLGTDVVTRGDRFSALLGDWVDLCQVDPRIYFLALTAFLREGEPTFKIPMILAAERELSTADFLSLRHY